MSCTWAAPELERAAFDAINHDWGFWCHEGTLARIESGRFNKTAAWVSDARFEDLSSRADDNA